MDDMFSGFNSSSPTNEWWECMRCHLKKPKFVVPPTDSKVTITFSQPNVETAKSVEPDESKYFDPKKQRKRKE